MDTDSDMSGSYGIEDSDYDDESGSNSDKIEDEDAASEGEYAVGHRQSMDETPGDSGAD